VSSAQSSCVNMGAACGHENPPDTAKPPIATSSCAEGGRLDSEPAFQSAHSAVHEELILADGYASIENIMAAVENLEEEGRLVEASALMANILQPASQRSVPAASVAVKAEGAVDASIGAIDAGVLTREEAS